MQVWIGYLSAMLQACDGAAACSMARSGRRTVRTMRWRPGTSAARYGHTLTAA